MELTDIRVKLVEQSEDRLRAFCSVTIDDCFVVREIRILDGKQGPFLAMPSRKLTDHCPACGGKNNLMARYCNDCGSPLAVPEVGTEGGHARFYADIAHPIKASCRDMIQQRVLAEFHAELRRAAEADPSILDGDIGLGP